MVFSSITFLFYFLPIFLISYFVCGKKFRNYILIIFSLIFYSFGGLLYLPLLLISIVINYFSGILIDKNKGSSKEKKYLFIGILLNLLFLGFFKYTNFFVDNINNVFSLSLNVPIISLPIGISFYTFQAISYLVDVYRNDGKVQKKFSNLLLYISMFPQILSGPIVRYKTIENQLENRETNFDNFNSGIERFVCGFFKKIVISDTIGALATLIYAIEIDELTVLTAWVGAIAYSFQIFFDFAGYSDMAIGIGKMLGFTLPENFNFPYISKSASEFWRRWHISLGTWFREYIYIPLGGNRVKPLLAYRNIAIVWLITGLWHGASWNFIFWGVYFGVFLMIEKSFLNKILEKLPKIISHIYLIIVVIFGWVIFSHSDMSKALEYIKVMLFMGGNPLVDGQAIFLIKDYAFELILAALLSAPIINYIVAKFKLEKAFSYIKPIALIGIFIITIIYTVNSTFNSFIYFNF